MRMLNKIILAIAFILSIVVIVVSIKMIGLNKESAALIAAALAVITSAFSSWSSQRLLEMQEDALQPYPYPFFDVTSRPGLTLFCIKNFGGTVAHDIEFVWDNGASFKFNDDRHKPDIKVLMPGASISYNRGIDVPENNPGKAFSGTIKFRNAARHELKHSFFMSLGQYDYSEKVDKEDSVTNLELQKIPRELKDLVGQLSGLREALEKFLKMKSSS